MTIKSIWIGFVGLYVVNIIFDKKTCCFGKYFENVQIILWLLYSSVLILVMISDIYWNLFVQIHLDTFCVVTFGYFFLTYNSFVLLIMFSVAKTGFWHVSDPSSLFYLSPIPARFLRCQKSNLDENFFLTGLNVKSRTDTWKFGVWRDTQKV